jgi:chromosomal replication initiation ATPase DnaA
LGQIAKSNPASLEPLQGRLDFGPPPFSRADFIEAPENANARRSLAAWQDWPGGALCLFGEAGTGKSHLASLWASEVGAAFVKAQDLDGPLSLELEKQNHFLVALDDADLADENTLFALLTRLERAGGRLLLTAKIAPNQWPVALKDLASRLHAMSKEVVEEPGLDLLAKLIIRYAAARGFKIDHASASYLAYRIPRTINAARGVSEAMDAVASVTLKTPMALAQRALRAYQPLSAYEGESGDLFEDDVGE